MEDWTPGEIASVVGKIAGFAVVVFAVLLFTAYQEAIAYNRITGSDVSVWEALWVELRIVYQQCQ